MAQRDASEVEIRVGEFGDSPHAVDAIDVREEGEEGEVPVLVIEGGEVDRREGDVVIFDGGWGWKGGEEFDVEGVC